MTLPERLTQLGLQDLAGTALWKRVAELDPTRDLEIGELGADLGPPLLRRGRGIRLQDHQGHRDLAPALVRGCHHRHFEHGWVRGESVLDLNRTDVLSPADDDVLRSVLDGDIAG